MNDVFAQRQSQVAPVPFILTVVCLLNLYAGLCFVIGSTIPITRRDTFITLTIHFNLCFAILVISNYLAYSLILM